MSTLRVASLAILALSVLLAPLRAAAASPLPAPGAPGDEPAGGRTPGSALVYPVHRSGGAYFTVVSVTNTALKPATPGQLGGTTDVHFEYANVVRNPIDPFSPLGCVVFDRVERLTPADTLSVLTSCHNAVAPGGQEGYLVVSAQDPTAFDRAWRHDALIGSSLVLNASGGAYSTNAISFRAGSGAPKGGDPTDVDGDGRVDFDGVEYEGVPDVLYVDVFLALLGSQLTLVNLTGPPGAFNVVDIDVWNDNEFPMSSTLWFSCWFDQPLNRVSSMFSAVFLSTLPHDPRELDLLCDGSFTIETGWARIDSIMVLGPQGGVVDVDGALLGCITAGPSSILDGGHLLWESKERQLNGEAFTP